jgi:hypothetical protein
LALSLVLLGERLKGLVNCDQVFWSVATGRELRVKSDALEAATSFLVPLRAGDIDQDSPHHPGGHRKKMCAILPPDAPRIDEPQIGFVDERRRLEDVVRTLARHLPPRQTTEVVMHDRNEFLERAIVTISPAQEQSGDVVRGRVGHRTSGINWICRHSTLLPGVRVVFSPCVAVTCELPPGSCAFLSHARDLPGGRHGMTALHTVLLHLFVASGAISVTPAVAGAVRPQIWVLLRNDARAEQRLVDNAKAEVTRLYALIDVDLIWVTEVPIPEIPLHVICLVIQEPDGKSLPESALGVTPAGLGHRGVLAYVFLRRIERASRRFKARIDFVLAVTISHELGHMLMPDGPHTKNGLMRAEWRDVDFDSASTGYLRFSHESADLIRRGLADQTVSSASARFTTPQVR